MPYVEPTKGKIKHTGRNKRLNIYNTDKYYNFSTLLAKDAENHFNINFDTKSALDNILATKSPMELAMDDTVYFYLQGALLTDNYVVTMIKKGMNVLYYVHTSVSDAILDALAESKKGAIIFGPRKTIDRDFINNVMKAHEATRVIMDMPLILPDSEPNKLLVHLSHFNTNVDEVQIDISPLREKELVDWRKPYYYYSLADGLYHPYAKNKFDFFLELKNPLSAWGMNITMIVDNEEEQKELEEMARRDKNGTKAR